MTAQPYPILEIDATFPDLGEKTGVFEFRKSTVEEGVRTGPIVAGAFSELLSVLSQITGDGAGRQGITIDPGGGQSFTEIDMESIGDDDGQWGYSNDAGVLDQATATGGDRVQKVQIFKNYLRYGSPDSLTPGRLKYGEWAPNGVMPDDYLDVYVEDPNALLDREQSSVLTGGLTLIETTDLTEVVSGEERTG